MISRTRGLLLTASNRKFDTSMSLSLQEFHLVESVESKENFIIQSPAPMIVDPSVSSAKSNQSASEHLSISISRYEPLSPKYVRAKGDVEIEFQMSHFAVTCKQSTLASLVNFLVTPMSDRSWSDQDVHHRLRRRHSTRFVDRCRNNSLPPHHHCCNNPLKQRNCRQKWRHWRDCASCSLFRRRCDSSTSSTS